MIHSDHALAHRLEGLICTEYRRLAEAGGRTFPESGAESIDVAGGVALWLGAGSPVNLAVGLGMEGTVKEKDFELLEAFYGERGAQAVTSMCPLADPSLVMYLGRRGWTVSEFEHVLVLALDQEPPEERAVLDVRVCTPSERDVWACVAALGFSDGMPPEPAQEEFGRVMATRDEAILVLAWADGQPAGTGALVIDGGVGWLSGDSTLPRYRGRGIQQAVQRLRLRLAREAGCELAVTETAPGSGSQRNMERLGFRIAYTHVEFVKGW